ncbi:hypothetical protein K440DRAFT_618116 [Wilcoxina mikolae CBS 423.85]|nr:hypothetical protein K440DRAFT_618116 [Wilcoxina mikolae CBS 423.85]
MASPTRTLSPSLVEISALATLVGATSAESFALGSKGATGLPWAGMSSFGLIYVIRGFIAAAVSDRARDTLGLRNAGVDSAMGVSVLADRRNPEPLTVDSGVIKGLWMHHVDDENVATREREVYSIHAFDRISSTITGGIPTSKPGDELVIYRFRPLPDPEITREVRWYWISMACSLVKLAEVFTLWHMGASYIYWVSALPWLHGFISALFLRLTNLYLDREDFRHRDVITGELPSPLHAGGPGKLLIGIPGNIRHHYWWKIIWGTGALVACSALLATFVNLSAQPSQIVYTWAEFQLFWLVLRIIIHQVVTQKGARRLGITTSYPWAAAPVQLRRRAIEMIMGLSRHLITIHPRGTKAYQDDTVDTLKVKELLQLAGDKFSEALPAKLMDDMSPENGAQMLGVVGDVVYRGLGWLQGTLNSEDLYDCALVFLQIAGKVHAVPSVRVLRRGIVAGDIESLPERFDPRGAREESSISDFERWVHWVPMVDEGGARFWAQLRDMTSIRAATKFTFMKPNELNNMLHKGILNVSIVGEDDVLRILQLSRDAAFMLQRIFSDAELQ